MKPIFTIYIIMGLISFIIYFFNLHKFNLRKKIIGNVYGEWSNKLNLNVQKNWLNWGIIIAYLSWSLYLIVSEPHKNNDYTSLFFLFIVLSFYPAWKIVIGSKGIILGTKVLLWEESVERKIIDKGKFKYLELKWTTDSAPLDIKTKRVPIPSKYLNALNKII